MSSHSHPTTTISTRQTPTDRKWFVSLQVKKNESTMAVTTATTNNDLILTPVGYSSERGIRDQVANEDGDRLFAKRSWDLATQPFKQLPMNMIFSWMAGSSLSLMSIMIVVMLFMKPIQSIFSLRAAFASLEQEAEPGKIWLFKLVFIIGNFTHLALALYKCQSMGLLPTYNSDWIAFADQQTHMEMTVGGLTYS